MSSPRLIAVAAALAFCLAAPAAADAGGKRTKTRYFFEVFKVELAEGVPADVEKLVAERLVAGIEKHKRLLAALADDAPDPEEQPKRFKRYLKRRRIEAFKVNVEVLSYEHEIEELPAPRRGRYLTVSISLRTFGETIPDRVMAFSGEGSSTVKVEIGKRLRERDSEYARNEATTLAIDKALAESIRKLDLPARKRKRSRGKK